MMTSIKPHPDTFGEDKKNVLIGTGERAVRLGIATIYVYSLGLYVDSDKCRDCLSNEYRGADHDALLRIPTFYPTFVDGKFKKTFNIVFCRSISKSKLVGGFSSSLKSRCDNESQVDEFLNNFCVEDGVHDNDMLTVICHDDGETIEGYFTTTTAASSATKRQKLFEMKSPGETGMWKAFQNLYFDNETAVPTIRHGAIALLPNLLATTSPPSITVNDEEGKKGDDSNNNNDNDVDDIMTNKELVEVAIEEQFVKGGSSTNFDWKDFSGRADGKTGYKFGDFSRGVTLSVFNTAKKAGKVISGTILEVGDNNNKNNNNNNDNSNIQNRSLNIVPREGTEGVVKDEKDIQIEQHLETIKSMSVELQRRNDKITKLENIMELSLFCFIIWLVSDAIWSLVVLIQPTIDFPTFAKESCLWIVIKLLLFLVLKPIITSPNSIQKILGKWKEKLKMD